jgi:hypothetical protein
MREALLVALGEDTTVVVHPTADAARCDDAAALTGLSSRAINALARCQVHTVGELLALPPRRCAPSTPSAPRPPTTSSRSRRHCSARLAGTTTPRGTSEPPARARPVRLARAVQKAPAQRRVALGARSRPICPRSARWPSLTRSELLGLPGYRPEEARRRRRGAPPVPRAHRKAGARRRRAHARPHLGARVAPAQ